MSVSQLDKDDQGLLRRCLLFVRASTQLAGEFHTRIGVSEAQMDTLIAHWPDAHDGDDRSAAAIAINNSLNEIIHGLHVTAADERAIGASRGAVQALYVRWAAIRGWSAQGMR